MCSFVGMTDTCYVPFSTSVVVSSVGRLNLEKIGCRSTDLFSVGL